ncbi:MAG: porphobilinogen synthase [Gemmatimonadota bacterium]|nr:MAG: porphobilinogen synthase [Gemmatimonadota bacterium]
MTGFPTTRLRRLRRTGMLRELVRETPLGPADLIYPMFVSELEAGRSPIASMPGVDRLSISELTRDALAAWEAGVRGVLLFGIPRERDEVGSSAAAADGIVQRAVRQLKSSIPELVVITDVCLCEYTSHGHCGIVRDGEVLNDETIERLAAQAVSHAEAGADIVAPSDMMDGRVGAIRAGLDGAGMEATAILSYAVKYASAFYGPFREAVDSAPRFGDRRGYQMDPGNVLEAVREAALDLQEGADILMVKPALPYLDVLRRVKERFGVPTAAYQVSGEYAMLRAAAERGWIDGDAALMEAVLAIRRAGADLVITYAAVELARRLA